MHNFFSHEYITDRIIRVRDASFTAVYLVLGDHSTALIDTGIGIGSLRTYIEGTIGVNADVVILTHGHLDHANGAGEFSDVPIYLNPLDKALMRQHQDAKRQLTMVRQTHDYYHLDSPELKAEDVMDYLDPEATLPLEDEQEFDLGGVQLKAIHTPGHTMGMTMILIEGERFLLTGDGCGVGVLLVEDCCSTVSEYRQGLAKLEKYSSCYDHILRNHGTCVSSKELIPSVREVCEEILNGTDDRIPTSTVLESSSDVFQAKKTFPGTQNRVDGKQGNIIYALNKIR